MPAGFGAVAALAATSAAEMEVEEGIDAAASFLLVVLHCHSVIELTRS